MHKTGMPRGAMTRSNNSCRGGATEKGDAGYPASTAGSVPLYAARAFLIALALLALATMARFVIDHTRF
jgi:hypothetical protein